ncbi:MAG: peptidoglycan DD-metalloendopeptidase family protein [Eubacteriales bacterium]
MNVTKVFRILTLVITVVMLVTAFPVAVSGVTYDKADYDDIKTEDLEAMRQQSAEYDRLLEEIKDNLNKASSLQASAAEKRRLYQTAEAVYRDQLKNLEAAKLFYEGEIEKTGKEIAELQLEYDEAYDTFLDLLRMTYEAGNANYIEIILGAESFSDLLARIDRVSSLIRYSDKLMVKIDDQKSELDAKRTDLIAKTEEQEKAILDIEAKQAEIEEWKKQNEAEFAEIEAEIEKLIGEQGKYEDLAALLNADFEAQVAAAIKAENDRRYQLAVEKELEEERKKQEALEEAIRKQSYLWPLSPSWKYISYGYGYRTIDELGYYNKFHYGIDMPAYYGTEIYASKAGRVLIATYHTSYGYYVLIDHGGGYQTLYAHCSMLKVKAGQTVDQGQVIALVGSTGTSTGNHLHFEVRVNGQKVDPLKYVTKP